MSRDPVWRSKAAFWTLVAAFAFLAGVPSVVLVQSVQRYVSFWFGVDPGALRSTTTRTVPHRGPRSLDDLPEMRFVEFKLKAPKAKLVALAGDFNQWKPEPLNRAKAGLWQILLPLPPGRYSYLFEVDGAWTSDPEAPSGGRYEDRPASLKDVK